MAFGFRSEGTEGVCGGFGVSLRVIPSLAIAPILEPIEPAYPHAWRYRDYVIDAFNRDLPYDQFIREQIAGDLPPDPSGGEVNVRGIAAGHAKTLRHGPAGNTGFRMAVSDGAAAG